MGIPIVAEAHVSEIVSEVSRYKRVTLGEREIEFLARIAKGYNSSYKIFSELKIEGRAMDYKNVNKRVRRLHELGLITKAKGESIHNAKYYSITSNGIFFILADIWIVAHDKSWIKNYKDYIVLRYLLRPYFEENTLEAFGIDFEVGKYLYDCCQMILSCSDFMRSITTKVAQSHIRAVEKGKELLLKQLQKDLEWQAKSLAFRMISKRTFFWNTFTFVEAMLKDEKLAELYSKKDYDPTSQYEDATAKHYVILAKDKKFMKFAKNLGEEYEKAHSSLVESAEKYKQIVSSFLPESK